MTEPHLSEEDLVLQYYGEIAGPDEAAAARHLESCARCRSEYTRLQRVLGAVDETALAPELPESFERTVWARLEPNLRLEDRGWRTWLGALRMPMAWGGAPYAAAAAVVLMVIAAFWAGRTTSPIPPAAATPASASTADQLRERILLVDVGQHLERSQMMLVELVSSAGEATADSGLERARANDLVADNRLYRQAAELSGDAALTDLLDEIDRVLTDVASTPAGAAADGLADVRRRIASRDLLFKVRVVSSELRERQREDLQRRTSPRS